jgi:hypothetical protein
MALAWRVPLFDGATAARVAARHPELARGRETGAHGRAAQARDVPLGQGRMIQSDADGLPLGDLFDIG